MKKFTKLLLASSCLLVGTNFVPSVDFNFVENVYAQEEDNTNTEEVINELLEGKIWASYGVWVNYQAKTSKSYSFFNNMDSYSLREIKRSTNNIIDNFSSDIQELALNEAISHEYMKLIISNDKGLETHKKEKGSSTSKVLKFHLEENSDNIYSFSSNEDNDGDYNYIYFIKQDDIIYSIYKQNENKDENGNSMLAFQKFVVLEDKALDPIKESLSYSLEDFNIDEPEIATTKPNKDIEDIEDIEEFKAMTKSMLTFEEFSIDYYLNAKEIGDKINALKVLKDELKFMANEVNKIYINQKKIFDYTSDILELQMSKEQYNRVVNEHNKLITLLNLDRTLKISFNNKEHVADILDETSDEMDKLNRKLVAEDVSQGAKELNKLYEKYR